MKHLRLSTSELEWLRWTVWEPLRRNEAYRQDYMDLVEKKFFDLEAVDRFTERWQLPWPISPTLEFKKLEKAPWLADLFSEHFTPHSDPAAFVPCSIFIVEGSWLRVFIDPIYSRKQIESELTKIYSQWLKTREFYCIERTERKPAEAFRRVRKIGDYIEVRLNLSATRRAILAGAEGVLKRIAKGKRTEHARPRLQVEKWRKAFEAYDLAFKTPSSIALALEKKPNTVVRMIQRAAIAVNAMDPDPKSLEQVKRWIKQRRKSCANSVSADLKCKRCGKDSAIRYCSDCNAELNRWLEATEIKQKRLEQYEREVHPV